MKDERDFLVEVEDTSVDEDDVDDKEDKVDIDDADDTEDHDEREAAFAEGLDLLLADPRPVDDCLFLLDGRSANPSSAYMSCVLRADAPVLGMKRPKDEEVGEVGRKLYELLFLEPEKDIVEVVVVVGGGAVRDLSLVSVECRAVK